MWRSWQGKKESGHSVLESIGNIYTHRSLSTAYQRSLFLLKDEKKFIECDLVPL